MPGAEAPMLVITEGQLAGHRWPIDQEVLLIGRSEGCDLVLPERQISRQHARLRREADGYYIEDLGSKNGTFINGQALPPFVPHGRPTVITSRIWAAKTGRSSTARRSPRLFLIG